MRPWVLPGLSGALIAAGWWVYIDGVQRQRAFALQPMPDSSWHVPGIIATVSALLMTCTPFDALAQNSFDLSSSRKSCGRCWLFFTFMMSFTAIVAALLLFGALAEPLQDTLTAVSWPEPGPITYLPAPIQGPPSSGDIWANIAASHVQYSSWPGIAAVIQTLFIFAGSMIWIMTRLRPANE